MVILGFDLSSFQSYCTWLRSLIKESIYGDANPILGSFNIEIDQLQDDRQAKILVLAL